MRRNLALTVSAVVAALVLPVAVNVATGTLPESWRPYLWLAWPLAVALAAGLVVQQVRAGKFAIDPGLEPAAAALAEGVRQRWGAELEAHDLRGPALLRLGWSADGADGDLDDITDWLLTHRQAVMLGGPGAGKTVLATVVTLGLLDRRRPGDPVPVLVAMSGWDPAEHLHTWLAGRLVADHSGLTPGAAARLLAAGLVLPVLDGLDELPAEVRAEALLGVKRAAGDGPFVLTSRPGEYRDAGPLERAAELELQAVDAAASIDYVTCGTPGDPRWRTVVDRLRDQPDDPLARTLSSPLMAWLARSTYREPVTDPAELLALAGEEQLESHLLNRFLETRYETGRPRRPTPDLRRKELQPYPADRARDWLESLAIYLRLSQLDTLVWWDMRTGLPRWLLPALCGAAGAVGGGLGGTIAFPGVAWPLVLAAVTGALCARFAYGLGKGSRPQVLTRQRGGLRHTARLLGREVLRAIQFGLPFTLLLATVLVIWRGWESFFGTFALGMVMMLVNGVAGGLRRGMDAQLTLVSSMRVIGPRSSLRASAVADLFGSAGTAVTAALLPLGLALGQSWLVTVNVMLPMDFIELDRALTEGAGLGLALATLGLSLSDWFAFQIVQVTFARRKLFPWRLMRFLEDAHVRGILRQVGGAYEFRHSRLREALDPGRNATG